MCKKNIFFSSNILNNRVFFLTILIHGNEGATKVLALLPIPAKESAAASWAHLRWTWSSCTASQLNLSPRRYFCHYGSTVGLQKVQEDSLHNSEMASLCPHNLSIKGWRETEFKIPPIKA
jgi:hypothetical protein